MVLAWSWNRSIPTTAILHVAPLAATICVILEVVITWQWSVPLDSYFLFLLVSSLVVFCPRIKSLDWGHWQVCCQAILRTRGIANSLSPPLSLLGQQAAFPVFLPSHFCISPFPTIPTGGRGCSLVTIQNVYPKGRPLLARNRHSRGGSLMRQACRERGREVKWEGEMILAFYQNWSS